MCAASDNQMVPIGAVAHLGVGGRARRSSPSTISIPRRRSSARRPRGVSSGQAMTAMEDIAKKTLPSDVGYQWTAMSYQEKLTGNQLYYLFGLSVLLVYLCLAGQYESWILPLAVLSAVPLALLGPVIALTSLGVANNLYTQIGLILMIALSAKNGILIVEMAREGRMVHGKPILEAAVEASRLRFRPILMTSFAFGLGVVPLVLATGAGATAVFRWGSACSAASSPRPVWRSCLSPPSSRCCRASRSGGRPGRSLCKLSPQIRFAIFPSDANVGSDLRGSDTRGRCRAGAAGSRPRRGSGRRWSLPARAFRRAGGGDFAALPPRRTRRLALSLSADPEEVARVVEQTRPTSSISALR